METTITRKGQVTIPKHIRDSLRLAPGSKLVFDVNAEGELVLRKSKQANPRRPDRFDRADERYYVAYFPTAPLIAP
jgi:antitoxin PrlF